MPFTWHLRSFFYAADADSFVPMLGIQKSDRTAQHHPNRGVVPCNTEFREVIESMALQRGIAF